MRRTPRAPGIEGARYAAHVNLEDGVSSSPPAAAGRGLGVWRSVSVAFLTEGRSNERPEGRRAGVSYLSAK